LAFFDDNKDGLRLRVARIRTGAAHADEPPSRVRHLITNVQVVETPDAETAKVASNFLVFKSRRNGEENLFVGCWEDTWRLHGGAWKLDERMIQLDHKRNREHHGALLSACHHWILKRWTRAQYDYSIWVPRLPWLRAAPRELDAASPRCWRRQAPQSQSRTDVAQEESVKALVQEVYDHFKRLDILVNNAGIFPMKRLRELDAATWDRTNGVNLRGAHLCTRHAAERIIAGKAGGRIVKAKYHSCCVEHRSACTRANRLGA
jgi:hypothetical protein